MLALLLLTQLDMPMAAHHARVDGKSIVWTTAIASSSYEEGSRWPLASPLPSGFEVVTGDGLVVERDEDRRIVALYSPHGGSSLTITLLGPLDETFHAPVLEGGMTQRVTIQPPARWVPDDALGLEAHVGYSTSPAVSEEARDELDRRARYRLPDPPRGAIYLTGAKAPTGQLLSSARTASIGVWAALAFASVVAGLFAAYAGLNKRAERERADAVLKAELDALTPDPAPRSAADRG